MTLNLTLHIRNTWLVLHAQHLASATYATLGYCYNRLWCIIYNYPGIIVTCGAVLSLTYKTTSADFSLRDIKPTIVSNY